MLQDKDIMVPTFVATTCISVTTRDALHFKISKFITRLWKFELASIKKNTLQDHNSSSHSHGADPLPASSMCSQDR
jgi:hypothetical protein